MDNKLFKYSKLFFIFWKINILRAMEYRINFLTSIFPTGAYSLGYVIFIWTVFSKIPSINGWTFDRMLTLFTIEQFFFYSSYFFYRHSLDYFSDSIRNGSFDQVLKFPTSSRLLVSFRDQEPYLLFPFIAAMGFLIYSLRNITIQPLNVIMFLILIFFGFFILYNFMFILASLSFWTTESTEMLETMDELTDLSRYPADIYHPIVSLVLLYLIPTLLIVYVPTTVLLGIFDWKLITYLLGAVVVSHLISQKIWQTGLKHYSSASS